MIKKLKLFSLTLSVLLLFTSCASQYQSSVIKNRNNVSGLGILKPKEYSQAEESSYVDEYLDIDYSYEDDSSQETSSVASSKPQVRTVKKVPVQSSAQTSSVVESSSSEQTSSISIAGYYSYTAPGETIAKTEKYSGNAVKWKDMSKSPVEPTGNPVLRYLVIGDTHLEYTNLKSAITNAYAYAAKQKYNKMDAILTLGDNSNTASSDELKKFSKTLHDTLNSVGGGNVDILACMGNHDYQNKPQSESKNKKLVANWEKLTKLKTNQTEIINGYYFISVNPSNSYLDISGESLNHLEDSLEEATKFNPDKPIFVITHAPIRNTTYGSNMIGGFYNSLYELLKKYPRVVLFTGHAHHYGTNLRSLYEDADYGFTCQSLSNLGKPVHSGDYVKISGYPDEKVPIVDIVEVYANNLTVIKYFNAKDNKFYSYQSEIGPGHDNTFDYRAKNSKNPHFGTFANLTVSSKKSTSCKINIPQAIDDEAVELYRIEVYSDNKRLDELTKYYSAQSYLINKPDVITAKISGLTSKTNYTVKVYAVDYYKNETKLPLSINFKTK